MLPVRPIFRNLNVFILLVTFGCFERDTPCIKSLPTSDKTGAYEIAGDSLFFTTTAYQYRKVYLKASKDITNIVWKIGDDPRDFTERQFYLVFNSVGEYTIKLTGIKTKECELAQEPYSYVGKLTIVPNNTISALVGRYSGNNVGESKKYTIEIKYWLGDRYPWWKDGAYSIHNLPENYSNSEQSFNGFLRPEIDGLIINNNFNSFYLDESGSITSMGIKCWGKLNADDQNKIEIAFKIIDTNLYDRTGQISYIDKIYRGIRIE